MELTIDTSSNWATIALCQRGQTLALFSWHTASNHSRELLPSIVCLLQRVKIDLQSVEMIVVARGPGSFNGLRVGIATAKGLSIALSIPLLGVDTLEAEAYPFAFTELPVRPIHKAGRDEIATALYRQEDDEWHCLEKTRLTTVSSVCRQTRRKTLFCGDIPPDIASEILQTLGKKAIIRRTGDPVRGSTLGALGWQRWNKGEQDDPIKLQPLYLRSPHITKPRPRTPPFAARSVAREKKQ